MKRRRFICNVGALTAGGVWGPGLLMGAGRRIRVGQIGTRHAHAGGKMESLRRSPEFEVAGLVVEPGTAESVTGSKTYAEVPVKTEEALLADKSVELIVVETEVKDLLATGRRAVAAGKHIHLDKPAGESLPEFRRLLEEAAAKKLTVQLGYMFRYNPAFQLCYRAVEQGWLGRVFSVHAVIGKVMSESARRELHPYPGGAMFELGCHVIDSVVRILGRPEKVTAHSRSSSRLGDGFADNQLAVMEYPGAIATVRSSIIEVEGFARRQFVVCGDEGTLDIRPLEGTRVRLALSRERDGYRKGYQDLEVAGYRRYDGDFEDLARVIRGEKEFDFSPAHDLAVQESVLVASGLPLD